MKHILSLSAISVLLAACSGGVGIGNGVSVGMGLGGKIGNVGIGTGVSIPLIFGQSKAEDNAKALPQTHIYFDNEGKVVSKESKNGYVRQVITKQKDGYLVQDFYGSGAKRSDVMLINEEHLNMLNAYPENGSYTIYQQNGKILKQLNYKNGKVVQ